MATNDERHMDLKRLCDKLKPDASVKPLIDGFVPRDLRYAVYLGRKPLCYTAESKQALSIVSALEAASTLVAVTIGALTDKAHSCEEVPHGV